MSSRIAAGLPPLKRTPGKTGAPGVGTKNLYGGAKVRAATDLGYTAEICSLGAALMGLLAHLTRDPDS